MDHVIRHIEDSGNFLVNYAGMLKQSGADGAYDWENTNAVTQIQGGERYYSIAYKKHAANWFAVSKSINRSIDNIAARQGTDTDGDGYADRPNSIGGARNAHLIVSAQDTQADRSGSDSETKLDHNPVSVEKSNQSFRQFMQFMVREIGIFAQDAKIGSSKETAILKSLENVRQSISGVNIDEELANMIKFQHGYAASARIITTMDRMLETIIGLIR
jgi:flagellar hook-associated protein 1 FlgK